MVPDGHRSGARESRGKALPTVLTRSPSIWFADSFPRTRQFSLIVTLLSVPEFAFTLPLISAFFAVSRPSGVRENAGGLPPLVMVGASAFQEHVVHEYLIALTNKHWSCVAIRRINNAIRLAATRNWLSLPSSVSSMLRPIPRHNVCRLWSAQF